MDLVGLALLEDCCDEDITTLATIPEGFRARGTIIAKEEGIVSGLEVARQVFTYGGADVEFKALVRDGCLVKPGDHIAIVEGDARTILSRERVALNFLQHLSGISTATNRYVRAAAGKSTILDTRKTLPGLRALEKYAVRMGGGQNHRMNLREMALIKDNHIVIVGSVGKAVGMVKARTDKMVEVEVKNLREVEEAVEAKPDRIMLDNMSLEEMRKAVEMIPPSIEVEASGNITLERIPRIAEIGIQYISIGAITHSVKALDMSLELEEG